MPTHTTGAQDTAFNGSVARAEKLMEDVTVLTEIIEELDAKLTEANETVENQASQLKEAEAEILRLEREIESHTS